MKTPRDRKPPRWLRSALNRAACRAGRQAAAAAERGVRAAVGPRAIEAWRSGADRDAVLSVIAGQ